MASTSSPEPGPYAILGVAKDATEKQIRSAYLKAAKTSHPDLNPGDPQAEARFKALNAAHTLLSDSARRAQFDRGEIDASGNERAQSGPPPGYQPYREHAEGAAGVRYRAPFDGDDDLGDILSDLLRARSTAQSRHANADRHYSLVVPFLDAMRGTTQRLTLPDGATMDVRIPPGLDAGQVLRLRGKGAGPHGDALIEVQVSPHALFRRIGRVDRYLDSQRPDIRSLDVPRQRRPHRQQLFGGDGRSGPALQRYLGIGRRHHDDHLERERKLPGGPGDHPYRRILCRARFRQDGSHHDQRCRHGLQVICSCVERKGT